VIPLLGVVLGTLLLRGFGAMGGSWKSWRASLVLPMGLMYVLTGMAHFTRMGDDLARFIPQGVPHPRLLVGIAGAIQIIAGLALLTRHWRGVGAGCLVTLLLIKLPLNWLGATHGIMVRGPLPTPPILRVPLVILWITVLVWIGWGPQDSAGASPDSTPSRN
jgi:uncharacterized membrane protein